jgi:hypothetical protein
MHSRPYKVSFEISKNIIHLKSDSSSPKSQLTKLQQSVDIQFRNKVRSTAGSLSPQSVHKSHKDMAKPPTPWAIRRSWHGAGIISSYGGDFFWRAWFVSQERHISRSRRFQRISNYLSQKEDQRWAPAVNSVWCLRQPLIGVRKSASLAIISKQEKSKALCDSRFSPEVTVDHVEKNVK